MVFSVCEGQEGLMAQVTEPDGIGWGVILTRKTEEHGTGISNPQEAELACRKSEAYMKYGIGPHQIIVLFPYSAQVRVLCGTISHDEVK